MASAATLGCLRARANQLWCASPELAALSVELNDLKVGHKRLSGTQRRERGNTTEGRLAVVSQLAGETGIELISLGEPNSPPTTPSSG
jgi:hypothetical protein